MCSITPSALRRTKFLLASLWVQAIADRLGRLLSAEDFAAILAQRRRWLAG